MGDCQLERPRVSVVVPNYNHAAYLDERIGSILSQTYRDWELIILDDCSTDSSREVIGKYLDDPRTSFHPNEKNSGSPFIQWAKGVSLARGEYVWLAESDDVADCRLLEKLVPILMANPRVSVAYCQSHSINTAGEVTGDFVSYTDEVPEGQWHQDFIREGEEAASQWMLWKNVIPNASAAVFRKSAFPADPKRLSEFRLCGDWLAWVMMLEKGDLAFCAEKLNSFRVHDQSMRATTREVQFVEERLAVREYILDRLGVGANALRTQQLFREIARLEGEIRSLKANYTGMVELHHRSLEVRVKSWVKGLMGKA